MSILDNEFKNTVAKVLKISPELLKEDSTAASIPQWDSLNHWTVIGELEQKYNLEFTMDEAVSFKNLNDIYETIVKKLQQERKS
jgi:acyl carrier protein